MIKVSQLLNSKINPLVHGALLNRIITSNDNKYFATISSFIKSSKIDESVIDFDSYCVKYINTLNKLSGNWISKEEYQLDLGFKLGHNIKALYIIENDLGITSISFYNQLYAKLFTDCDYINDNYLSQQKKLFIRGFCELCGSIDTNRYYLSNDYHFSSLFEMGKARLLIEYFFIPYYLVNINFRDCQKQFVLNINRRKPQLRLQINWYCNHIGLINEYKANIVKNAYTSSFNIVDDICYFKMNELQSRQSNLFAERLSYFSNKVFGKELTTNDITKIRQDLGFDNQVTTVVGRNKEIVELVRYFSDDICAGCSDVYNIKDRTFIHRKTGRPYFEIHHNISFASNLELDHEDNLVKLCPVCHSCLKGGVGLQEQQLAIIKNIITNKENVKLFASHFFNTDDEDELIELVYRSLK